MRDFVLISKDQKEKFKEEAVKLGLDLVFLYKYDGQKVKDLSSDEGIFLEKEVHKDFSEFNIVVALGTSFNKLPKGVTHVVMNEFEKEKDFVHQRRSGLNHVFLNEFKGEILFAFAGLQESVVSSQRSAISRQGQVIGRMMQNAKLCSDWKLVSFASDTFSLRHSGDVKAFSRLLEKKQL